MKLFFLAKFYVAMSLELLCLETEIPQRVFKTHKKTLTKSIHPLQQFSLTKTLHIFLTPMERELKGSQEQS